MLFHNSHNVLRLVPLHGFGNRMLVLASGIRLIQLNAFNRLEVCWRPSGDLNAQLRDLLTGPFQTINYKQLNEPLLNLGHNSRIPTGDNLTIKAFTSFTYEGDTSTKEQMAQQLHDAMSSIMFMDHHYTAANQHNTNERIGLHCRRADFQTHDINCQSPTAIFKYYDQLDEMFAATIEKTYTIEQLFLASDSAKTTAYFSNQFGKRLVWHPKQHYPLWAKRSKETVDEGIIDFILLSRCSRIIGDSRSTFSAAASIYGGIEKIIWARPKFQS